MRVILLIVKYNDSQHGSSKDNLGTRLEGRMIARIYTWK